MKAYVSEKVIVDLMRHAIGLMRHAIGADRVRPPTPGHAGRNWYCAGVGSDTAGAWDLLVSRGHATKLRGWMIVQLRIEPELYVDRQTGEANLTALAEACAHAHEHDEWLDDPDHELWDAAIEAARRSGYGVRS